MSDLINERLEQIRERDRIGTIRGAMEDRTFLLSELDRLRDQITESYRNNPAAARQRPMDDFYGRSFDA